MGLFPNSVKDRIKGGYKYTDAYQLVSWAYACINCIADAISGVPIKFYQQTTDGSEPKEVPLGHPVYDVFNPPLEFEIPSFQEYVRIIFINLGISGEIFSNAELTGSKVTDLSLQPAGAYTPELDKVTGKFIGWKFDPRAAGIQYGNLKPRLLKPGEVIQFRYYNPYVKYRGLSPLMAGRLALEQEINMSMWNAGFFEGGGLRNPIAILLRRTFGGDKQRKEYLDTIEKNFAGYMRGQGPFVVEGGADVRPLLNSIKDLDFPEGKQLTREDICSLFGVPPAMVGIMRYASYANAKEQSKLFWLNTLTPKMRNFRDTLNVNFLKYHFPGIFCDFDWDEIDALEEDPVSEATEHNLEATACKTYKELGYSDAKVALLLENDDFLFEEDEADEEEEEEMEGETPTDQDDEEEEEPVETIYLRSNMLKSEAKGQSLLLSPTPEYLSQYATNYQKMHLSAQVKMYRKFIEQFAQELSASIKKNKGPLDLTTHSALWQRSVRPIISRTLVAGIGQAHLELQNPIDALSSFLQRMPDEKSAFEIVSEENPTSIVDFFCKRSAKSAELLVSGINGLASSGDVLEKVGETVYQLFISEDDIVSLIGKIYHHGRLLAHLSNGVIKHRWTCHGCKVAGHKELHSAEVLIGKDFSPEAGSYPSSSDQTGCTCTTFPSEISLVPGEKD